MAWKKSASCWGWKTAIKWERQQVLWSLWELDNCTQDDFMSLAERQLWDMQNELLALQEASKEE